LIEWQVKQIAHIHHNHLVKLIGYYEDSYQQLLVYEYLPNGNVGSHLYGTLSLYVYVTFVSPRLISLVLNACGYANMQTVKVYLLEGWICGEGYLLLQARPKVNLSWL